MLLSSNQKGGSDFRVADQSLSQLSHKKMENLNNIPAPQPNSQRYTRTSRAENEQICKYLHSRPARSTRDKPAGPYFYTSYAFFKNKPGNGHNNNNNDEGDIFLEFSGTDSLAWSARGSREMRADKNAKY